MRGIGCNAAGALAVALLLVTTAVAQDDSFIRGYVAAILQRDFQIEETAVSVHNGVVTVRADLSETERQRLGTALEKIAGVQRVDVVAADAAPSRWSWIPDRELFRPLIADPRWPRFAAGYQYYIGDQRFSNVAAVSFGESFPLLQYDAGRYGTWQTGIQASVFAIFDLDSASFDLINADYFVALPLAYALGDFSALLRFYHQSSHLGDEFLLTSDIQRVNLSYEALDLLLSYESELGLRGYGGASYIVAADPSDLKRWSLQGGLEYIGEPLAVGWPIRPVAAVDLQLHEEGGWTPNVSPNLGLQFGSSTSSPRNVRLLLQYFNGKSPNGQFYDHHIQYIGVGAQLNF